MLPQTVCLFLSEGQAVSALVNSRVCFVRTYHDALQRTIICLITVMCALLDSTFNALVCVAVHDPFLLLP